MIFDKYLPIGSVVLLKGAQKKLMIFGRYQKEKDEDKVWDYIGCLYPEGNLDLEHSYLFQHEQIDTVYYLGCVNEEEQEFQKILQDSANGTLDSPIK